MNLPADIEAVALLGWHVYPCNTRTKAGCFKGATDVASCDLNVLARWAREYPGCGWRVVFGPSRIWGLDLDVPPLHEHDGVSAFAELVKVHGNMPDRPTMRSGGGGIGVFFRHDGERIIGDSGRPAPGCDPRRGRQSQTIPPSVHGITGKPYRWVTPPWKVSPPTAPAWLLRLLAPLEPSYTRPEIDTTDQARRALYRATERVLRAGGGERNVTLNKQAFRVGTLVGSGRLAEQEAIDALYGAARQAGLDHGEAKATIRSGLLAGYRKPAEAPRAR